MEPAHQYSWQQWSAENHAKYINAEKQRSEAERLTKELERLCEETADITTHSQKEVNKKLEQRLDDIEFWKTELEQKLQDTKTEVENLLTYKTRLEKALKASQEPLEIAQLCLEHRKHRVGEEQVRDAVQGELLREVAGIQEVMSLLEKTLDQTTEQIRLCRSAKYYIEKDLKDKQTALAIDSHCSNLRSNTASADMLQGDQIAHVTSTTTVTDPNGWQTFSNNNIQKAERECHNGLNLRLLIDSMLKQTAKDMKAQCDSVNTAFGHRVAETKDAKERLEMHLAQINAQLSDMEFNITRLREAIVAKGAPLNLAHVRLGTRTQRPNVELCYDPVQSRLQVELGEIQMSVNRLQQKLEDAEAAQKALERTRLSLEADIEVKANTLYIDNVQCVGMRCRINVQKY
ncbi:PREDICTED: tektin-1-like [Priapulus caudatus]|uniref:Tektin n=1 Tax=Priapulus caudatus TaxID=37621 RepID=A0ABM1E290_PRICU|nr:PREDICTED: tektin-1-like [Priapulus caudatus]